MSRAEFHRVYSDCEGLEGVELIEGVVCMSSPVRIIHHTRPQTLALRWLTAYEERNPGLVEALRPGSVLLDDANEPIPDVMLLRTATAEFVDGYLTTAPDLIIEIAASSKARDLHQKKRAYERNGVGDYLVWRVEDRALDWFILRDGLYFRREPDTDGVIASEQFPGLRLDVPALLAMDRKRVLAAVRGR